MIGFDSSWRGGTVSMGANGGELCYEDRFLICVCERSTIFGGRYENFWCSK